MTSNVNNPPTDTYETNESEKNLNIHLLNSFTNNITNQFEILTKLH